MQENTPKKGGTPIGLIFLVLALMGLSSLVTYLLVKNNEETKREEIVTSKNNEIEGLTTKMKEISKQLDDKIAEARKLGADYKSLQAYKEQLESDIVALKQSNELSQVQVRQYTQKIQAFEKMIAAKDKELQELKEQNAQLSEEKDSLLVTTDSLKSEKASLSKNLDEVTETNKVLKDAASVLRAENITITALNARDKEESRNVFRAKRIDKVTVDFNLAKNLLANSGNKDVYLRLLEPSGTVIINRAIGSGNFDSDGKSMNYTLRKQVMYNNDTQSVKMAFDKPKDYDFNTGKYAIELYCEGKQIGYKTFEVK